MKKQMTRILSVMMTVIMIFTMLPITALAEETKVQIINAYELATKSKMTIGDGYTLQAEDYWCMIHTSDSMRAVYCIEPGKHVLSGDKYNENAADDYLKKVKNKTLSTEEIQAALRKTFLYAYTGKLDTAESYVKYAASQMLVWEVIVGQRDSDFKRISNGYTSVEKMLSNFKSEYAGQQVSKYYYDYEAKIKKDKKSVSFGKSSKEKAKASAVKAGSDGTYTFKDKNGQLENFDVTVNNGTVASKSGNSLKIKAENGKTAMVTLTQNNVKESGELTGFLTLTSDSRQTLAKLKTGKRKYYAAVKGLSNGNLEIIKTSEDGIVANIEFTVKGNGRTYNVKTDSEGRIKIPDLTAGEYTVTEVVPVRYKSQQTKKVTVQSGKTASVSFSNTLKTGAIKINKQSEDGEIGNRTFEIKGNGKTYTINTNSDGIAVLSGIPVYDKDNRKITYTISEKNVPIKYVVPANQKTTLTADATTEKTFKNVLKKFTAEVIKKDSEYECTQGDGSLAGAVYGLYLDGELIDEYVTDENGYFKTKEYVCGDDWTIREITASEGYMLDETVYSVGAEAKNYTIEHNNISLTVKEEVIKGKISLIKHSDDGTTQIETPEEGAEFEVYLKSAGSYEKAKESEKDYLVCDKNGFDETKLLPYGVYAVRQTKGWENTELMQDFEVVINENEKNYFYLINDAVLKSFVKIVKKDAETGKTICASGIGFKVWDCANERYIEQKINYPSEMVLDIFYTDESGTLMLPCELIYGNYELHEAQTANGYVLDKTPVPFKAEISLDENMKASFSEKLPFAKYYVREIAADEHYILGDKKYSFDFKYSEETETVNIDCVEFENKLKRGTVKGLKTDDKGSPLENAVFGLFKADCTEFTEENALMTAKSDDKGCFSFADISFGEFAVREIKAPKGYILSDKVYQVNITEDGQTVEIEAENKPITVEFSKRDTEGNELKGAKLQIIDEKGNIIEEWISDGTNHIVKKLTEGKYVLTETAAPDGYEIATDISFEVLEDGTVKVGNTETTAISKDGNPLIVMVDEAEEKQITPQTGDNRSRLLGVLLTGTGLSILVILILKSRKKKGEKDEK